MSVTLPSRPANTTVDERVPYSSSLMKSGERIRSRSRPTPVSGNRLSANGTGSDSAENISSGSKFSLFHNGIETRLGDIYLRPTRIEQVIGYSMDPRRDRTG